MYFMIDPAGTVLSVNRYGAEQLGYGIEELVGHTFLDVFHEADLDAARCHVAACLEHFDRPMSWQLSEVRKDRTMLWIRQTARAIRRAGGDSGDDELRRLRGRGVRRRHDSRHQRAHAGPGTRGVLRRGTADIAKSRRMVDLPCRLHRPMRVSHEDC